MNAMIKRSATIIKLPIDNESLINFPENIILDFGQKGTLDIGALCYLTRNNKFNRRKRYTTRPVDLSSYCEERAHNIQKLILDTSKSIQFSEISASKAHYQIQTGLIPFINWIDEHGHHKSFYSEVSARPVFREYNLFVLRRISKGEINSTTASAQIRSLLSILNQHLNIENLHEGANIPRKKNSETNTTKPVEEASQARFLSLCKTLFDGLSNFVINNHPYPFALHPPKHLAVDNHTMWIRPKSRWLACTPSTKQTGDELFSYYFPETPIHLDGDTLDTLFCALKNKLKKEEKNLKQANTNRNSHHRCRMAKIAHDAFFQLFLAHTGINLTQASQLWWEGDYSLEMDRQGFRTIKWRARGLVQSFEIQSIFTKDFKAFLELRKYLLKGNTASHLFFKLGSKEKSQPKPITSTDSGNFYKILLKIDPELPKITSRQWRASKADWMLRNGVPSQITAIALQNSEATIRKSYAAGSPITHRQEMSTFLDRVSEVVLGHKHAIENSIKGPLGSCTNLGEPHSENNTSPPILPDCRNPEGCLFCDKHRIHADETDTRKLLSYKYCIQQTAHLAEHSEHFERVIEPIIKRIDKILQLIEDRSEDKKMLENIQHSVEVMGELDSYWTNKLELLIHLDLIPQQNENSI